MKIRKGSTKIKLKYAVGMLNGTLFCNEDVGCYALCQIAVDKYLELKDELGDSSGIPTYVAVSPDTTELWILPKSDRGGEIRARYYPHMIEV